MARIYDLTGDDPDGDAVLQGDTGGLLTSRYLADDPPVAYLSEHEEPQYVLRNTSSGVTVTRGSTAEEILPDDDHQAIAVVTDVRVHFLVGAESGDRARAVALADVATADAERTGLLGSELRVETVDGEVWTFPVRGNVTDAAEYVDDAAQTWANASRLVDDARDRIDQSREYLDDGAFDSARGGLEDVSRTLSTARDRIQTVGRGAEAALDERAAALDDRLGQLRREIAAMEGARHHAQAQSVWNDDRDFEAAASHYDRAIEEYGRALAADGSTPADAALEERLDGAAREREILRVAPMAAASAARAAARAADNPETAAAEWEAALACYRDSVTLDWGADGVSFLVDRDLARERAAEATDEAIDAHVEAGEEWLLAADRIAARGNREDAKQGYERARDHFAAAQDIARDLRQGRVEGLEERLSTVDDRIAGEVVPSIVPRKTNLSVSTATAVIDEQASVDHSRRVSGFRTAGEGDTDQAAGRGGDDTDAPDEGGPEAEADDSNLLAALRALDEREVTALVADLLSAEGWTTTVFTSTNRTVYDIVALRDGQRQLVWTFHRPDGGALSATVVRRCATACNRSKGADRATLVTTGALSETTRARANELGVTALDGETLVERVTAAGLSDRLR